MSSDPTPNPTPPPSSPPPPRQTLDHEIPGFREALSNLSAVLSRSNLHIAQILLTPRQSPHVSLPPTRVELLSPTLAPTTTAEQPSRLQPLSLPWPHSPRRPRPPKRASTTPDPQHPIYPPKRKRYSDPVPGPSIPAQPPSAAFWGTVLEQQPPQAQTPLVTPSAPPPPIHLQPSQPTLHRSTTFPAPPLRLRTPSQLQRAAPPPSRQRFLRQATSFLGRLSPLPIRQPVPSPGTTAAARIPTPPPPILPVSGDTLHLSPPALSASGSDVSHPVGTDPARVHGTGSGARAKRGRRGGTAQEPRAQYFECELCGTRFRRKSDKNRHVRVVHEKSRPFICPLCNKSFGEKSNMLKHRASVHDDVRTFRCPYCDQNFAQRGLCDTHVRTVHDKKQAKYFCEHCGLPFSRKVQLNEHYETVHSEFMAAYGRFYLGLATTAAPPDRAMVGDTVLQERAGPLPPFGTPGAGPAEGTTQPQAGPSGYAEGQPGPAYEQRSPAPEEGGPSRRRSFQGDSSG